MIAGSVSPPVLYALGSVFAVLLVASATVAVLRRRQPERDHSNLVDRVKSWWVMVAVFSLALLMSRRVSLVFFGFLSFLAFKEYLSVIPTRRADRRVLFWAYLSIPFQFVWIDMAWYGMFIIWIPVYVFLLLPVRMVLAGETTGFLRSAGTIHWGLMTTVFALSHVAYLLVLPPAGDPAGGGPALVVFIVFLTQANDICQYVFGRLLGRRRVVPTVSPGKTLAGLIGGLLSSTVLAIALAPWLTPLSPWRSVFVGVFVGLAGFFGDVVISALKRDLGIKDSGALLPGHGGILDRLDSLMYTAPLFFHFIRYAYY